jgi:LmbE family N-acetylglucosaminyl deacetylase
MALEAVVPAGPPGATRPATAPGGHDLTTPEDLPDRQEAGERPGSEVTVKPRTGPVLACFAHPDDMEIGIGGLMARWRVEGRELHLLILTNGDRGSQDPGLDRAELARTRVEEQRAAGAVLGLADFQILGTPDGELANTREVQLAVARAARRIRPDTVVTCDPTAVFLGNRYYNHSDHRNAGWATLDGVFPGAGNPHFFEELLAEGLQPWDVPQIYLCWSNEPNTYEDVTGHLNTKLAALAEHASQLDEGIAPFEKWLRSEAADHGKRIGVEHAEAFRVLELE